MRTNWVVLPMNNLQIVVWSNFSNANILEVRLVGGSRCSGRVEVLHRMIWVQVCDADFTKQDAEIVCRELGCGPPIEVLGASAFGSGEAQEWTKEFQCKGNESQIHFCQISTLKHNCSYSNYVGLACTGKSLILTIKNINEIARNLVEV